MKRKRFKRRIALISFIMVVIFVLAACSNNDMEELVITEVGEVLDIMVPYGTFSDDAINQLDSLIRVKLSNGFEEEVEIAWEAPEDYEAIVPATYKFTGQYKIKEISDFVEAEVTVLEKGVSSPTDAPELLEANLNKIMFSDNVHSNFIVLEFNHLMDMVPVDIFLPQSVSHKYGFEVEVEGIEVDILDVIPISENFAERIYDEEFWLELYMSSEEFIDFIKENYGASKETNLIALALSDNHNITEGQKVEISYDSTATGATATDIYGNPLESFSPVEVINNIRTVELLKASVEDNSANELLLEFSEKMSMSIPEDSISFMTTDGFVLEVEGEKRDISFDPNKAGKSEDEVVIIDLGSPIKADEEITISYDDVSGNSTDIYGNHLKSFEKIEVVNNTTVPTFNKAYIEDAEIPDELIVEFSKDIDYIDNGIDPEQGFTVRINGEIEDVIYRSHFENKLTLALDDDQIEFKEGDQVTIAYDPATGNIIDNAANKVSAFSAEVVDNQVIDIIWEAPEVLAVEAVGLIDIIVEFDQEISMNNIADKINIMLGEKSVNIDDIVLDDMNDNAIRIHLAPGSELERDYSTADASIDIEAGAVESVGDEILINEAVQSLKIIDRINPKQISHKVIASDSSDSSDTSDTIEIAFSEKVYFKVDETDFRSKIGPCDGLNLTGSVATISDNIVTIKLEEGREIPLDFDLPDVDEDVVVDKEGNANTLSR